MSTDFFAACRECVARQRNSLHPHVHVDPEAQDMIMAHEFFGGKERGLQVEFLHGADRWDSGNILVSRSGEVVTIGELRKRIGAGKE